MASKRLIVLQLLISLAMCTVDLNIHHLQFVADHMDADECKRLVNSLHQNTFDLLETVNGSAEPDKPCIALLLKYDRTEGYNKTFNDLILRLGQTGHSDIADRLSKSVYEEDAEELDRLFLSNPFKKEVPKDSFLMDTKKKDEDEPTEESDEDLSAWEITSIVFGGVIGTGIIVYVIYYLFGDALYRSFREYAPQFMVKWTELVSAEGGFLCRKTKRKFMKEVLGSNDEKARAHQVAAMNRNLNNYLNGHLPDADEYFDELLSRGRWC